MERRIFGLENEYGVTCTLRGQRRLSPDEVARYLFRKVVSLGPQLQRLPRERRPPLPRRRQPPRVRHARVRLDPRPRRARQGGGALSSSTCSSSAEQRLREEGIRGVIYLFKNNTDSAGNSYGCHENYLTSRRDDFGHYAEVLIPFFVSRQIYAGAGKVLQTARGAIYCISQRAEHIWEGVSSATTRSRPIINTRDEPHADAERFRRLHVIVGDSNMSEYATFLKVGATSILLRMLEDPRVVLRDMTLENPIRAIREISHDPTCKRKVRLANGRELLGPRDPDRVPQPGPALRRPARASARSRSRRSACGSTASTGHREGSVSLDRECDWVIKHKLIEAYRDRHDLPLTHPKVALHRPPVPRRQPRPRPLLPDAAPGPRRAHVHRRGDRPRAWSSRPRPRGPSSGASSSRRPRRRAATSPSTGCTSSSTTRPSAPCCARTRSRRRTSGSRSSSPSVGARAQLPHRDCHRDPVGASGSAAGRRRLGRRPTADAAYVLTQLIGAVAVGDRVVVNTTAVDLGLGTGGWDVVHWNLGRESWSAARRRSRHEAALHEPPGRHRRRRGGRMRRPTTSDGATWWRATCTARSRAWPPPFATPPQSGRLVYVMTDSAALPLALLRPRARPARRRPACRHGHRRPGLRRRPRSRQRGVGTGHGRPSGRSRRHRRRARSRSRGYRHPSGLQRPRGGDDRRYRRAPARVPSCRPARVRCRPIAIAIGG